MGYRELDEQHRQEYVIANEVIKFLDQKGLTLKQKSTILSKTYHMIRKERRGGK